MNVCPAIVVLSGIDSITGALFDTNVANDWSRELMLEDANDSVAVSDCWPSFSSVGGLSTDTVNDPVAVSMPSDTETVKLYGEPAMSSASEVHVIRPVLLMFAPAGFCVRV